MTLARGSNTHSGMYRATTRAVQVTVEPTFDAGESAPDEGHYFWTYRIEIVNLGEEVVVLRSRHWRITDSSGKVENVRGAGVVGKQPVLKPGETFVYTSGCPLKTPFGIMEGTYQMENERGEMFCIDIPAFSLDMPGAPRTMN